MTTVLRIARLYDRLRPQQGWLPFVLLAGSLACLVLSVLEVKWVPGDSAVVFSVVLGFLAAALMAQRSVHPAVAWTLLAAGGLFVSLFLAAGLRPPARILAEGPAAMSEFWQRQLSLFADRAVGWARAVSGGGRSTETVVFALGLALAGWFVAAFLAWSTYRQRRPYVGLTVAGFALAANTFYGQAGLYWAVIFVGLAVTVATYLNYLNREQEWERTGMDYSSEVRMDLLIYAAGISLAITSLAIALPAINFRAIAEAFQRQEAVVQAEQTLDRAFAGVRQPRTDEGALSAGGMPRSFLLGGDPQLAETIAMTATVRPVVATEIGLGQFHWRSVSYDDYTGRGWRRSPEREQPVDREQPIPTAGETLSPAAKVVELAQEVRWTFDRRATRYTLGRPLLFSHDVAVQWRGAADFVGVRGRNNAPFQYTARTRVVIATAGELRTARPEEVPAEVLARYTALPDDLPQRVYDLARDVAGLNASGSGSVPPSAYDQAVAIEAFLRQYPYTLDLLRPPDDVDIVDYFLFDLQRGFCDYYASAMVVMARALGLPARLAAGFLQQPPDARGIQTVRQINAHSWAEVYFAGYGWVEFEPTAPFASPHSAAPASGDAQQPAAQATYEPPIGPGIAIPERAPQRATPRWPWLLALAALTAVIWRLWGRAALARRREPRPILDDVQAAYAGLESGAASIGYPPRAGQTPAEFAATLLETFSGLEELRPLRPDVQRLAQLFAVRQYGRGASPEAAADARAAWAALRRPLRRQVWRRLARSNRRQPDQD